MATSLDPHPTPEQVKEALKTAFETCEQTECPMADAMAACTPEIKDFIEHEMKEALSIGMHPVTGLFSAGAHFGYRLHQLIIKAPTPADKVN